MIVNIDRLKDIAEIEFNDIVDMAVITDINQLRLFMKESSIIGKNRTFLNWLDRCDSDS